MATADYSLMSLLLFFFYIHPLDSVKAANLGQTHYTVTVQVYTLGEVHGTYSSVKK